MTLLRHRLSVHFTKDQDEIRCVLSPYKDVLLGQMAETRRKSHVKDEGKVERELNHELRSARSHQKLKQLNLQGGVLCHSSLGKPGQGAINKTCSLPPLLYRE